MPKPPLPPQLQELLAKPNPAVIGTVRPDGTPNTVATWYLWEDGRVLVNMDEGRRRLEYLRRDPSVSLTVLDGAEWYRHITLHGRVTLQDDPDLHDIDRLATHYTGSPYARRDRGRVSGWIEVEQLARLERRTSVELTGALRTALGAVVAVLLAGCSGSDPEDGDAPRPRAKTAEAGLTSGEFVRQVDALCKSVNPELAAINAAVVRARDKARAGTVGLPGTFQTFARLLDRASAITRRFEARLREIPAPPAERDFHEALLGSLAAGSSNLRRQVSAAKRQDAAGLRDLSVEGSRLNAGSKGLVAGHGGFRFCGRG